MNRNVVRPAAGGAGCELFEIDPGTGQQSRSVAADQPPLDEQREIVGVLEKRHCRALQREAIKPADQREQQSVA